MKVILLRKSGLSRLFAIFIAFFLIYTVTETCSAASKIKVITTITDYAWLAREIGGDLVEAKSLAEGHQDVHYVRPKPSFANLLKNADMFVTTGLDLELWVPGLLEKAANTKVMSGQVGYVAAADGVKLLDKPQVLSRSEGGLHVYGNPHITVSPVNIVKIADNIRIGLSKVSPENAATFKANYQALKSKIARKLCGDRIVEILGEDLVLEMASNGTLIDFLSKKQHGGKPLLELLDGWLKKALPARGVKVITYHRTWPYFEKLVGINIAGELEPKPGIPPSPQHVANLIDKMRRENIKIIWGENYFDQGLMKQVAEKIGGVAVIVPVYVGGEPGINDYFSLMDLWITRLVQAVETSSRK